MGALRNICYDVYNTASLALWEQREITVSIGVIHRARVITQASLKEVRQAWP